MSTRTARRSPRRPTAPQEVEGGIPVAAPDAEPQEEVQAVYVAPVAPAAPARPANAAEDSRAYRNDQVRTLADLKRQPKIPVMLPWTDQDDENLRAGNPMPYPQYECVTINGVEWWIKRGEYMQVPMSVAEVLVHARHLPPEALPEGNQCRAQAIRDRAERRQMASNTDRWNRIIQGQSA